MKVSPEVLKWVFQSFQLGSITLKAICRSSASSSGDVETRIEVTTNER